MRIAYISYEYPPDSANGGIATYVAQVSRMMTRRGHEVEVFAASPHRDETVVHEGVTEHWIRETDRADFGILAGHRFAARHGEAPFDVLEGPEYNADARKAVELVPGIPLVVKMHTPSLRIALLNASPATGPYVREFLKGLRTLVASVVKRRRLYSLRFTLPQLEAARLVDLVERRHAGHAALVAHPSLDLGTYAEKEWGIPQDVIRHSPYSYIPKPALLKIAPGGSGLTVGFVGRLERRKGFEIFAKVVPLVVAAVPGVKFRFIGASDHHAETGVAYDVWLRTQLRGFEHLLEFNGKVPLEEMPGAYEALDVCVYPSLWENFPNVCLEAMSAGRAIVGSAAGGMAEMLDGGKAGRLIQPGDFKKVAEEIIALLRDPAERARLGAKARERTLQAYNEEVIGEMMEAQYRGAIGRKSRTDHHPVFG